jgi:hypothetical protein
MRTEINGVLNIETMKANISAEIVAIDESVAIASGYRNGYIYDMILRFFDIIENPYGDKVYPITQEEAIEFVTEYDRLISEINNAKNLGTSKEQLKSELTSNYGFNISAVVDKWY